MQTQRQYIAGNTSLFERFNVFENEIVADGWRDRLPTYNQWVTIFITDKIPAELIPFGVYDSGTGLYVGIGVVNINGNVDVFCSTQDTLVGLFFSVKYFY